MTVFYTHIFFYQAEGPLMNQSDETHEIFPQESLTVPQVFAAIGLRKPLMVVSLVMVSQQVAGKQNFTLQFSSVSLRNNLKGINAGEDPFIITITTS